MKMLILFLFISSISLNTFAQAKLAQIEVNSKSSLEIFKLMFSHLDLYPPQKYTPEMIKEDFRKINNNLRGIAPKSAQSFLFSELYKTFFNFDQSDLVDANNIYISGANIKVINDKLTKYRDLLTPFSSFLIKDMLKNYQQFEKDNYINNYLNTSDIKYDKPALKKKINKLNKHVGPWLMLFSRYDSKNFNKICTKYIRNYLQTITYLSQYFKYQKLSQDGVDIFLLSIDKTQSQPAPKSKDEGSTKSSNSPKDDVKSLRVEPGEGAAPKIEEIIENLDQKKQ